MCQSLSGPGAAPGQWLTESQPPSCVRSAPVMRGLGRKPVPGPPRVGACRKDLCCPVPRLPSRTGDPPSQGGAGLTVRPRQPCASHRLSPVPSPISWGSPEQLSWPPGPRCAPRRTSEKDPPPRDLPAECCFQRSCTGDLDASESSVCALNDTVLAVGRQPRESCT